MISPDSNPLNSHLEKSTFFQIVVNVFMLKCVNPQFVTDRQLFRHRRHHLLSSKAHLRWVFKRTWKGPRTNMMYHITVPISTKAFSTIRDNSFITRAPAFRVTGFCIFPSFLIHPFSPALLLAYFLPTNEKGGKRIMHNEQKVQTQIGKFEKLSGIQAWISARDYYTKRDLF